MESGGAMGNIVEMGRSMVEAITNVASNLGIDDNTKKNDEDKKKKKIFLMTIQIMEINVKPKKTLSKESFLSLSDSEM